MVIGKCLILMFFCYYEGFVCGIVGTIEMLCLLMCFMSVWCLFICLVGDKGLL